LIPRSTFRAALLCALILGPAAALPARAQILVGEAAAGIEIPLGSMAERRFAGPLLAAGLRYEPDGSLWAWRGELGWSRQFGRTIPVYGPGADIDHADLRSLALSLAVLRHAAEAPTRPYLLLGAGLRWMQLDEAWENPYGSIVTLFTGAGMEWKLAGPWRLFGEARLQSTLSDYGAAAYWAGFQLPLLVGIGRELGPAPSVTLPRLPDGEAAARWRPDHSRLITLPTGRGVGHGGVRASLSGSWSPLTVSSLQRELVLLRPALAVGVTDWITLEAGYWPRRIPADLRPPVHQRGQVNTGLKVTLPLGDFRLALGGQLNHILGSDFDRDIAESVGYALLHRGAAGGGWTAGVGVRGFPQGGSSPGWHREWVALGGGYRALGPHLEAVGEAHLELYGLVVRPGLRAGFEGLSVEASFACGVFGGMGWDGGCAGPSLTASWRR
jgi:hypothetical protein